MDGICLKFMANFNYSQSFCHKFVAERDIFNYFVLFFFLLNMSDLDLEPMSYVL